MAAAVRSAEAATASETKTKEQIRAVILTVSTKESQVGIMAEDLQEKELQETIPEQAETIKNRIRKNRKGLLMVIILDAALSAFLLLIILGTKNPGYSKELVTYKLIVFLSAAHALYMTVKCSAVNYDLRAEYYELVPQERPDQETLRKKQEIIRKWIKRLILTGICAAAVLTLVQVKNYLAAQEAYEAWKSDAVVCGVYDDVDWKITEDNTLVIGNGTDQTFQNRNTRCWTDYPWYEYRSQITAVRVEGNVKGKGSLGYMFFGIYADSWELSGLDVTEINDLYEWALFLMWNVE